MQKTDALTTMPNLIVVILKGGKCGSDTVARYCLNVRKLMTRLAISRRSSDGNPTPHFVMSSPSAYLEW